MTTNRIRTGNITEASPIDQSESASSLLDVAAHASQSIKSPADHVCLPIRGFTSENRWPDKEVLSYMKGVLYVNQDEILNLLLPLFPEPRRPALLGAVIAAQFITFMPENLRGEMLPDEIDLYLPGLEGCVGPQSIRDLLVNISSAVYSCRPDRVQDLIAAKFITSGSDRGEALRWAELLCLAEAVLLREGRLTDLEGKAHDFETPVRKLRNQFLVPAMIEHLEAGQESQDASLGAVKEVCIAS